MSFGHKKCTYSSIHSSNQAVYVTITCQMLGVVLLLVDVQGGLREIHWW